MEFFFIICKINIVIHVVKSYLLCCIVEVLGCANLDSFCHEIYDDLKPRLFWTVWSVRVKAAQREFSVGIGQVQARHEEIRKFPPFPELEVFFVEEVVTHIQLFHATTMHHHGWDFITCWLHANVQWFRFWLPSWKLSQLKSSLATSSVEGVSASEVCWGVDRIADYEIKSIFRLFWRERDDAKFERVIKMFLMLSSVNGLLDCTN